MTEGRRPGGLTALAVLNLVGGAFSFLGALSLLLVLAVAHGVVELPEEMKSEMGEMVRAWKQIGTGLLAGLIALEVASVFLLISSGIGYLKQKKFWGRVVGNVWAVYSIALQIVSMMLVVAEAGGGFTLLTMAFLVYPVLTLVLLNTTFKEDFVR